MSTEEKSDLVWRAWAGFDAFHIISYFVHSLGRGNVPLISDVRSTVDTVEAYGEAAYVFVAIGWLFELSIYVSCYLFFTKRRSARWLGFIQTPFRLFLMVPSVSLLPTVLGIFPSYYVPLAVALVVLSELMKCWSLWRFGSMPGR